GEHGGERAAGRRTPAATSPRAPGAGPRRAGRARRAGSARRGRPRSCRPASWGSCAPGSLRTHGIALAGSPGPLGDAELARFPVRHLARAVGVGLGDRREAAPLDHPDDLADDALRLPAVADIEVDLDRQFAIAVLD